VEHGEKLTVQSGGGPDAIQPVLLVNTRSAPATQGTNTQVSAHHDGPRGLLTLGEGQSCVGGRGPVVPPPHAGEVRGGGARGCRGTRGGAGGDGEPRGAEGRGRGERAAQRLAAGAERSEVTRSRGSVIVSKRWYLSGLEYRLVWF